MTYPTWFARTPEDPETSPSDPGLDAVAHVFRRLQVDAEWSDWSARGFTWWMGQLAQEVTADPPVWSNRVFVSRVVARTTVALEVPQTPEVLEQLARLNAIATTSSLVLRGSGELQLVTTAIAHEVIRSWLPDHFSLRVAVQAAEAEVAARPLCERLGGRPALSSHPTAGARSTRDDMTDIIDRLILPEGQGRSHWQGADMREALECFQRVSLLASGDDTALSAEFPFRDFSCLVQFDTSAAHPSVGYGLRATLRLPWLPFGASAADCAATLNLMDAKGLSLFSSVFGGWGVSPSGEVAFHAFFSNVAKTRVSATNIALWMSGKAEWVASLDDPRSREERLAEGKPAVAHLLNLVDDED